MRVALGLLSALFAMPNLALCRSLDSVDKTPLALLQEAPDVDVRSTLTLGDTQSYTPALDPAPGLSGSYEFDAYGNRYTGEYRPGLTLNYGGLLGASDQLSVHSLGSSGDGHYHRVAYHLAAGPWETRLGILLADMSYRAGKELEVLDAHGTVRTSSGFVVQPLIRTHEFNLLARVQYDKKRLNDDIDLISIRSQQQSRVLTYSLSGDSHDGLLGGGRNGFALSWSEGRSENDGLPITLNGYTGSGRFRIARASLMRLQHLSDRIDLFARAQGQWSHASLDDSEKLYLGGGYGVRAYPANEAPGDAGWLANLELRYALTRAWQVATFIDHGESRFNTPNWIQDQVRQKRSGAGVVARWASENWHLSLISAWKVGNVEAQSDVERTPRVWGQVVRYF